MTSIFARMYALATSSRDAKDLEKLGFENTGECKHLAKRLTRKEKTAKLKEDPKFVEHIEITGTYPNALGVYAFVLEDGRIGYIGQGKIQSRMGCYEHNDDPRDRSNPCQKVRKFILDELDRKKPVYVYIVFKPKIPTEEDQIRGALQSSAYESAERMLINYIKPLWNGRPKSSE